MNDISRNGSLKKRGILIILTIILTLSFSLGAIYFINKFEDSRANELATGLISIDFIEGSEVINLTDQVPVLDEIGLKNTPYEFTVKNTSQVPINAKIALEVDSSTTTHLGAVRYAFYVEDELIKIDTVANLEEGILHTVNNLGVRETVNCKIIFWIDYYYETSLDTFKAKIKATGESFDIIYEEPPTNIQEFKTYVLENRSESIIEEDEIIYISGKPDDYNRKTTDDVDYNYVWYSGKLWRITAIYPDGTMKMITEDLMTSIAWGASATVSDTDTTSAYSTSWIREWLNQEFLPTLYNYEDIIVTDYMWNATTTSSSTSKPAETTMITDPVGMLTAYEYYKSYQKLGTNFTASQESYLKNGNLSWLITPYSTSNVWSISSGLLNNRVSTSSLGLRPSINLKSTIKLSGGDGNYDNPYTIKGDNSVIVPNTTLLNTRQSGEYIKLDDDTDTTRLFRIVGTEKVGEKLTTKLVLNDYIKTTDTAVKKLFSNDYTYGDGASTSYWDYYLNNTYLGTLNSNMLEQGTYYLGMYPDATSYKTTVCSSVDSTKSISDCINEGNIVDSKWIGHVGLLRVGEMFATRKKYYSGSIDYMCLITPMTTSSIRAISTGNIVESSNHLSTLYRARPTINLTSTVVIKSGTGTEWDPFVVGLPS